MCLDGWFKLKWSVCLESVTRKVLEYFGTFPGSLYIKPWHANTDLFTMSDKWNITVWSKIPACVSNTVMVFNQWLILIHCWWVTNETGQLVCTALTVSTAQAYDGLQLATDTDLFLMGEK